VRRIDDGWVVVVVDGGWIGDEACCRGEACYGRRGGDG
jgi:hypothetical protein